MHFCILWNNLCSVNFDFQMVQNRTLLLDWTLFMCITVDVFWIQFGKHHYFCVYFIMKERNFWFSFPIKCLSVWCKFQMGQIGLFGSFSLFLFSRRGCARLMLFLSHLYGKVHDFWYQYQGMEFIYRKISHYILHLFHKYMSIKIP